MKLGIGGYIIPFYFLFMPGYLWEGSLWWVLYLIFSGTVAMFAIEAGCMGFLTKNSTPLERIVYFAAGLLILGNLEYSIAGLLLFGFGYLLERWDLPIPVIGKRRAKAH
jgi:TRAP-type uncharacterized transport system fused permease subunit